MACVSCLLSMCDETGSYGINGFLCVLAISVACVGISVSERDDIGFYSAFRWIKNDVEVHVSIM
jgi:hypothetical protein